MLFLPPVVLDISVYYDVRVRLLIRYKYFWIPNIRIKHFSVPSRWNLVFSQWLYMEYEIIGSQWVFGLGTFLKILCFRKSQAHRGRNSFRSKVLPRVFFWKLFCPFQNFKARANAFNYESVVEVNEKCYILASGGASMFEGRIGKKFCLLPSSFLWYCL